MLRVRPDPSRARNMSAEHTNSGTARRVTRQAGAPLAPAHPTTTHPAAHPLDFVSLGKIVQIREQLMQAQAAGKRVFRFESGDPSFTPAPHVVDAVTQAAHAGKTHYVPNNGIPELRRALARKIATRNGLAGVTPEDVFVTNGAMHALHVVF